MSKAGAKHVARTGAGATFPYPSTPGVLGLPAQQVRRSIISRSAPAAASVSSANRLWTSRIRCANSNEEIAKQGRPRPPFPTVLGADVITYISVVNRSVAAHWTCARDIFLGASRMERAGDRRSQPGRQASRSRHSCWHRSDGSALLTSSRSTCAVSPAWKAGPGTERKYVACRPRCKGK